MQKPSNPKRESPAMPLSEDERRVIALWAADCAERVLPLFEAIAPADERPAAAIEGARAFGRGGPRTARLRELVWAAYAAAREVNDPPATAAARSAGVAAGTAYMHPLATLDQAKHLLGPEVYAAQARELAAGGDANAADAEIRWAIAHAPPSVRAVLARMPARGRGRSRMDALYHALDAGLRA